MFCFTLESRARKIIESANAEGEMPVNYLEWRFLIPPVHVYRALKVNQCLTDARGYAGWVVDGDKDGRRDRAPEYLKKAKEALEESRWFRNASDEEVYDREMNHYSWILLGGRPVYPA